MKAHAGKKRVRGSGPRRVGVAAAKARFTDILRKAETQVTLIQNRGRDVAAVISIADYEALVSGAPRGFAGKRLRHELAEWRSKFGGVEFEPERISFAPSEFRSISR